jgi:glycosyltransferase involved in cell wall biosynthesis
MRILFLNSIGSNKWGGGEKWMLMAARGLQERGHTVTIGCAPDSEICKNALVKDLSVVPLLFKTDFDIVGLIRLLKVLRAQQIDVVICGQNKDTKIAALAAKMTGHVKVIARHGLQLIRKKWKYKWIFTRMIHGIITNSESIRREYDTYGWFSQDFVKVIFNGFTPPKMVEVVNIREEFRLGPDTTVIFSAGRLASQKGYEILIGAAAEARKSGKNWVFIVAGKGKLKRQLEKMVKRQGLEKMVFFKGFIHDVLPYIKSSDIFVLPSYYEGMPNAVMEAMGLAKCCVVTSVNGNNELIDDGREGLLVQAGDVDGFYRAIDRVAVDVDYRQTLGTNAYLKMQELFSEDRMIDSIQEFLISKTQNQVVAGRKI